MARYGLPLDDENELAFFVHDSNGIEIMYPDAFGDWVWTEFAEDQPLMIDRKPYEIPYVWVLTRDDYPRNPRGTSVRFGVTENPDGTKDFAVNTSKGPVMVNGKRYVIKVGFPNPAENPAT